MENNKNKKKLQRKVSSDSDDSIETKRKYHSTTTDESSTDTDSETEGLRNVKRSNTLDSINSEMEDLNMSSDTDDESDKKHDNYDIILRELMDHQLHDIPSQWKLTINDMKRICSYIKTSIFSKSKCAIWNGYITNRDQANNKGTYVNFFFNGKKVALHRLLHINYVYPLDESWYLKFKCKNKGKCCNVNHCEKFKYTKINKKKKIVTNKKKTMTINSSNKMKICLDSESDNCLDSD